MTLPLSNLFALMHNVLERPQRCKRLYYSLEKRPPLIGGNPVALSPPHRVLVVSMRTRDNRCHEVLHPNDLVVPNSQHNTLQLRWNLCLTELTHPIILAV